MISIRESGERFAQDYIMKGVSRKMVIDLFMPNMFRESDKEYAFCAQEGNDMLLDTENGKIIESMIIESLHKFRKNRNKALNVYREYVWYISRIDGIEIEIDWENVRRKVFGQIVSQDRLSKQMEFILEVDKLKEIYRQTYVSNGKRKENDAEHSWHLALMAYVLKEYANEPIDVLRVMLMVLLHDVVEIDAGDTYAYDQEAHKTKAAREQAAAERIFNILPEEQAKLFRYLWEEFEENVTPEARFANSLDRLQPIMLNDATNGKAWEERSEANYEGVTKRFLTCQKGSEKLWELGQGVIDKNKKKGKLS